MNGVCYWGIRYWGLGIRYCYLAVLKTVYYFKWLTAIF